jgi:adenylyltransferase/sulfurtransferase
MIDFTNEQLERYSRHILLQDVGVEGQIKLLEAKVLIIGAGGLGAPAALYLAAAGIGTIGIVDNDTVDISNLQRQIVHFTKDIGIPKVESAKETMLAINPDVTVNTYQECLRAENICDIICGYDFIVDGTDNFPTKFLVNDACVMENIPFSHGGILRFDGQTMTVVPGKSSCYRCSFTKPPPPDAVPTCSQAGVLGAIAGMLGTIQAAETLKYITGVGELLTDTLLSFNAKNMEFRKIKLRKQPSCPLCGNNPTITELIDAEQSVCGLKKPGGGSGAVEN